MRTMGAQSVLLAGPGTMAAMAVWLGATVPARGGELRRPDLEVVREAPAGRILAAVDPESATDAHRGVVELKVGDRRWDVCLEMDASGRKKCVVLRSSGTVITEEFSGLRSFLGRGLPLEAEGREIRVVVEPNILFPLESRVHVAAEGEARVTMSVGDLVAELGARGVGFRLGEEGYWAFLATDLAAEGTPRSRTLYLVRSWPRPYRVHPVPESVIPDEGALIVRWKGRRVSLSRESGKIVVRGMKP